MKKTYVVIGLGKFGMAVASRLCALGNEVLAIDTNAELVQRAEPYVTCAAVGDARDEEVLASLGAGGCDCAVVAIGEDLATSVIVTLNLKELGLKQILCKATDEIQKKALEKVGADRVVVPEREMGLKLAQTLTSSSVFDYIELSSDYGIAEVKVPGVWVGKTLREVNVRVNYGINIIAVRTGEEIDVTPGGDRLLTAEHVLVAVGSSEQFARLPK